MIDARLFLSALDLERAGSGTSLVCRDSFVDIFPSVYLEMAHRPVSAGMEIVVGEVGIIKRWLGRERKGFTFGEEDSFEGIRILIRASNNEIVIDRTIAGTCPIYVSASANGLAASWKFESVARAFGKLQVDVSVCRRFMDRGVQQTREQILVGTFMLWPGETCRFTDGRLSFQEASPRPIPAFTPLRDDAPVSDVFFELIMAEIEQRASVSGRMLFEFSGGLDSTTVALAGSQVLGSAVTYGLIQEGVVGQQQARRRNEVIELGKFIDHMHPANDVRPFEGLDHDEAAYVVLDDNHRMPCVRAADSHPAGPFEAILSGIGGDELMGEHTYIRSADELPGAICTSSLTAATARADMFLRRGLWPINPLCSLAVVDFCRALPPHFRSKRFLIRVNLARRGLSDGFLFPRLDEHYGYTMRAELGFVDFDEMFRDTIVERFGIYPINDLLQEARSARTDGFPYRLIGRLWDLAKLERVLRTYIDDA